MSAPNVTEIRPFGVPSFDKSEIEVHFQWDPLASVEFSVLFMRGQEALEVVSLHDHPPSVIWKAPGMAPGILNVVIIETEDGSCNISSIHPVSVLPGAAASEMIGVFKKTETYCWETSPCLTPPLEHQNSTETPLSLETEDHISQNSASLTRQYVWKDQVKPFAMDLEFLLTELEENGGDGSELLDVVRNISTFLIEVNAKETLRFVLETCADFNVQYSWGPVSIDSELGLNRLYEMVRFQRPNEEEEEVEEEEDNSNEEVDFNNDFGGSSESEEFSENLQAQEEEMDVVVDDDDYNYQGVGGVDGIVRLGSSDDLTSEQLLPPLEDEPWRPIQVSEAPMMFNSLATCANSSAFDNQASLTDPSSYDLQSPIQWCTIHQTLVDEDDVSEEVEDKSEVGREEVDSCERDNQQQDSDPANSGSDIVVQGDGSFGGTMVTIGVGRYSVIGILLPTLVLSWWLWLSFKASPSSSSNVFFGDTLQQGSGVFLSFIFTVLVLFILKKLASMSCNIPKLDSITRFVLFQALTGIGFSLFAQHFHVEEASRLICLVQALQVVTTGLGVLIKTQLRVSIHFQLCLFFIDIVTFFFIVSHYSNTYYYYYYYCSNEENNNSNSNNYCFSVFTTYLVGKVFVLFLASIDGHRQIQRDQSTKMMS